MSPRRKGPDLFVKVDKDHGIALVSVAHDRDFTARDILDRANIPYRPSRKGRRHDLVIRVENLPDLDSWCHWQNMLVAWSPPRPKAVHPRVEPVFVAPEPEPEPEPDPFEQDKLFGG